ncbi:penicillin-binding transpeptidase domain-containing protein (plasmid) [Herbiconiux sp. KACC 21604]|uniref:penicillin-binding transpeptidase domain-containing protein n=1 Tax=Herbiconiux sp. KACC 21604 TaxID=3092664 RepID=UPI00388DA5E6|nr:penicillin-binding transpeptidase domain-containing protein [Herbiconiux sp. KACC 21604]
MAPFVVTVALAVNVSGPERLVLAGMCALAAFVTLLCDPKHRASLAGILWSVAAVGVVMQLRLTSRVWPVAADDQFGASVLRMTFLLGGAIAVLAVTAVITRVARDRRFDPPPTLLLGVALFALVLRLLPAVAGGGLSAGTLAFPGVGSVQVGELTRFVLVLCVAFAMHAFMTRADLLPARRGALIGTMLTAAVYVGVVGLLDAGPALLSAAGMLIVWWLTTHQGNPLPRLVLPVAVAATGVLAIGAGLLVSEPLREQALSKFGEIEERFGNILSDDPQLLLGRVALAEGGAIGAGPGSSSLASQVPEANSDMIAASIGADLGALPLAGLVIGAVWVSIVLIDGVARRRGPLEAAAVALCFIGAVQVLWPTLAAMGFAPLTGISAGMLAPTGTTLMMTAATVGVGLGATGVEEAPAAPRALSSVLWAATAATVAGALVAALMPWNVSGFDAMRQRGQIVSVDGAVLATTTWSSTQGSDTIEPEREYRNGPLYGEVTGREWGAFGHSRLEESAAGTLTCGGAAPWWAFAERLLHPVPCRPADVVVTIHSDIQEAAANALQGRRGAAVVLDAANGDTIAMYSTGVTDPSGWKPQDKDGQSFLAGQAEIAPGSVLKPFVAAVGLVDGVGTDGSPRRQFTIDGESLSNSGDAVCNDVSLTGALSASCNTPFAKMATEIGAEPLAQGLTKYFGFDEGLTLDGLPVSGVYTGLTADVAGGALARTGIGQESVQASPLALAGGYALIVAALTGKDAAAPRLVAGTCDAGEFHPAPMAATATAQLPEPVASEVYDGMLGAIERVDGTLHTLDAVAVGLDAEVAGKSGTAEVPTTTSSTGLAHWTALLVNKRYVVVTLVLDEDPADNPAKVVAGELLPAVAGLESGQAGCFA